MKAQQVGDGRFFFEVHDLTSYVSSTRHDFLPVEWALCQVRQRMVTNNMGMPLLHHMKILPRCSSSQFSWARLFNFFPCLAACKVSFGTAEARLQDGSRQVRYSSNHLTACPKYTVSSGFYSQLLRSNQGLQIVCIILGATQDTLMNHSVDSFSLLVLVSLLVLGFCGDHCDPIGVTSLVLGRLVGR